MDGAAQVARNVIIGALQFGRHARAVIRQVHAQGRDSKPVQQFAERQMALFVRIPLRQHQHGPAVIPVGGKEGGAHHVVLRVGRLDGTGESELSGLIASGRIQPVIRGRLVGEETAGIGQHGADEFAERLAGASVGGWHSEPVEPPLKRAHDTVAVAGGEFVLPVGDPARIELGHLRETLSVAEPGQKNTPLQATGLAAGSAQPLGGNAPKLKTSYYPGARVLQARGHRLSRCKQWRRVSGRFRFP